MRGITAARRGRQGSAARRVCLAALLAAALLGAGASSASAVVVRLANSQTLSYLPVRAARISPAFDEFFTNLDYNGGPVMPSNTNYAFFWDPAGAPAYPSDYQSGLELYFEDLAHDSGGHQNTDSVSAQYNDTAGEFANYSSHFGGTLIDTDPYPKNGCKRASICLTDEQLRGELAGYVKANKLPTGLSTEYFILTPPGVEDCFEAKGFECSAGSKSPLYCAYHENVPTGEGEVIYANDPFVSGNPLCDEGDHPNGKTSDGAIQGGLSHEHNESITDPEPNSAWTDFGGFTGEEGDKCRTFEEGTEFGTPLGEVEVEGKKEKYNQVINGHFYWYQQEWSNQGHQCMQRFTLSGEEPTATFTSDVLKGHEVKFDATGSTAGKHVRYNWQFNDGPGASTPTETESLTVTHGFAVGGTYDVALTVFTENGTSIGTAHTVKVGTPPQPTLAKLSPKVGARAGGTTVIISGTGFNEVSAVKFGSSEAHSFTVQTPDSISAVTPAEAKGTVEVTVSTPGGTSAPAKKAHFKFK